MNNVVFWCLISATLINSVTIGLVAWLVCIKTEKPQRDEMENV